LSERAEDPRERIPGGSDRCSGGWQGTLGGKRPLFYCPR